MDDKPITVGSNEQSDDDSKPIETNTDDVLEQINGLVVNVQNVLKEVNITQYYLFKYNILMVIPTHTFT